MLLVLLFLAHIILLNVMQEINRVIVFFQYYAMLPAAYIDSSNIYINGYRR